LQNHTNNFLKCFGNNPKNKLGDKNEKENEQSRFENR